MNLISWLSAVRSGIDTANAWLGRMVSVFSVLMVVLTFAIVVLRYGFNLGWIALQESVMYLHASLFLLACSYALQKNEHVRVDIFYRGFSGRRKAWVDLLGAVLLLMPVSVFIFVMCWDYVMTSWQMMERSGEAGGLPLVYALKSLLLLFATSLCLQGVAEVIRNALTLHKGETA
ncbi:TRAP transporter small permease subunit [Aestuariibacter halophilus]|uniref:TRAP transporter small permease protein n=1 Tax=Fluctibacter halophilus TaxID=226011 RepID=A0ABS8GBD7_9ALTE|nr:TRAP transporter small permease subunit [Aestuariibacter halophilus]MCC2617905.1 TRAP transporter small permease subunit [Aestuariibacter halophilus]